MKKSASTPWIVGTAVVSAALLAIAWFLAISPQLDEASLAREEATQEAERNSLLEIQIAQLKADFENIEEFRTTLAGLQVQIPESFEQAAFNREIAEVSLGTGAFVVDVTMSTSTPVLSSLAAIPGAAATLGAPAGLHAVPTTVTVLGNPLSSLEYVKALQTGTSRLFLATGISLTGQDEAGASGGRPATAAGDAEIVISGYVYVLDPSTGTAPVAAEESAEAAETTTS